MVVYSDDQSERLLNAVAAPLWITNDHIIHFMNQAALDLVGGTLSDYIGQPFANLFTPDDRSHVEQWLENGESAHTLDARLLIETAIRLQYKTVHYGKEAALMITAVETVQPVITNLSSNATRLELFEQVMKNAPTGMMIIEAKPPEYPIVYANDAAAFLCGVSLTDLWSTEYQLAVITDILAEHRQDFIMALENNQNYSFTNHWEDENGEKWWANIEALPLSINDTRYMVIIIHDVTEQQLAQQSEREQRQLVQALLEAGSTLNRTLSTDTLLQQTVNILKQIIPHDFTNIMLVDEEDAVIRLRQGYPDNYDAYPPNDRISLQHPILDYMIKTGEYCVIPDTEYPPSPDITLTPERRRWIRSFVGVPIQTHNHILGFISLGSQTTNFFNESQATKLVAFAGHVAVALQNAWLYEQAQQEITDRKESEQLFRVLAENLPDGVFILDPEKRTTVYANQEEFLGYATHELELRDNFLELVHPSDRAALLNFWQNVDQHPSEFHQIELRIKHKKIEKWEWIHNRQTFLNFGDVQKPQKRFMILTQITDFRETESQLRRRNQDLEAINAISLVLNSSLDLNKILAEVLAYLQILVNYDSASLFFIQDNESIEFVLSKGFDDATVEQMKQAKFWVYDEVKDFTDYPPTMLIPDVREEDESFWISIKGTEWIRSTMILHLAHQGQMVAVLNLDKAEVGYFTQDHADKLAPLTQQIAMAISNARLYDRAQNEIAERRRAEDTLMQTLIRTDALYQITRVLMLPQVIPELLDIVASVLGKTLRCQSVAMMTLDVAHQSISRRAQWGMPIPLGATFHDIWHGQAGDVIRSHQTVFTQDTQRQVKQLIIPIQERGFIFLENSMAQSDFTESDEQLLMTIAGQLAVALENNALYAELEEQVAERTSQLTLERQRLRAILDGTGEGVLYMEDFRIQYINSAFCDMIDRKQDELIGTSLTPYTMSPDPESSSDMWYKSIKTTLQRKTVVRVEKPLYRKNGTAFPASMIFTRISEADEEPFSVVAVVRDISLEQDLQQQKDRFLSNAAHELRTPLTSFILRLHMLRRQPERISNHLKSMDAVADRMKQLVDELVEINRLDQGRASVNWQRVDMLDVINQVIKDREDTLTAKQIQLKFQLPEKSIFVRADWRYLQQAVSNLLTHALDYSEDADKIDLELKANGDGIRLIVRDYGELIPDEYLPDHIFDPFARPNMGDQQGTGLGLTLARKVAQMHGGDVTAANNSDKSGNTLTLYLPIDINE